MQMKTTVRYHYIFPSTALIKKTDDIKCGQGCQGIGTRVYFW